MPVDGSVGPVLILAPIGRDAEVARAILANAGIAAEICPDLAALVQRLDASAGAILAEEALLRGDRRALAEWIERQPPWSDLPFILLTYREAPSDPRLPGLLGNVTVLERPPRPRAPVPATPPRQRRGLRLAGAAAPARSRSLPEGARRLGGAPGAADPRA